MSNSNYNRSGSAGDCLPLLDACTPFVYRHNAFRVTGLQVDAPPRAVKRRIDDLKHAEELGDAEEEHVHAFALNPPPKLEQIREAALKLQDPECRLVEEFFWFWPMEWGNSSADLAICALKKREKQSAYQFWMKASTTRSTDGATARHNLAVMYQLIALDLEQHALKRQLSEKDQATIANHWKACFKYWEDLAVDEEFWGIISVRVRARSDERLTTGFVRRMRATLPEALDKINAMLAVGFIEKGKPKLARLHIDYMKATHQGLDNVPKVLASIVKPLVGRIQIAVERAAEVAEHESEKAAEAAHDMFHAVSDSVEMLKIILPPDDHNRIDPCDSVAEAALSCYLAMESVSQYQEQGIAILDSALSIVESQDVRARILEHHALAEDAELLDPVIKACQHANRMVEHRPENGFKVGDHLLSTARIMFAELAQRCAPQHIMRCARDEVAGTVMHSAVVFGNKTKQWLQCERLLEAALKVAATAELSKMILTNLDTVRRNQTVPSTMHPISVAPKLTAPVGISLGLFGAADRDPDNDSYEATHALMLFGVPVLPLGRYRVVKETDGYRFLGKVSLRPVDKWLLGSVIGLLLLLYVAVASFLEPEEKRSSRSSGSSSTRNAPTTYSSGRFGGDRSSREARSARDNRLSKSG